MKLHWSPRSPYVRKVMVAAHELALVDRLDCVRSLAAMSTTNPAIMADNPLSKIPALVLDDSQVIVDSTVIVEYLDSLAGGGRLLPTNGPARWQTLSRHALAQGVIDLLILWRNERDKPPPQQTPAWLDAFAAKVAATLDEFERAPPSGPLDMVGIALGCALAYADFRFAALSWRTGRPALAAWYATFDARPSAQATAFVDA